MKARRKSDGAIIEVREIDAVLVEDSIPFARYFADEKGAIYIETDLDFSLSEPEEEVTIEGWVARDENGMLCVYTSKPERDSSPIIIEPDYWNGEFLCRLEDAQFPSVTWESEPLAVTITIKPKKK